MTALARSSVRYQVYGYNRVLETWLYVTQATEDEQEARDALDEQRRLYPGTRFQLVRIENTVTILEGSAE
jgi:hypothetical protein